MTNATNNGFSATSARIWLRDGLPARELFLASEAARLDGVDAQLALLGPNTGAMSYCEVKVTGHKWRFEGVFGTWRLTCRVRFVGHDDTGDWHVAEFVAQTPAERLTQLAEAGLLTESLREIA